MTTRDQVIYQLQDLYAFQRDILPLLDELHHESGNGQLRELLGRQRDSLRSELETLEQSLNLLGARHKMERNPVALAFKEATQRFKHQANPSQEQLDLFTLTKLTAVSELMLGVLRGMRELAVAIGEQDVARLLEESRVRLDGHLHTLRDFTPTLLQDIGGAEARRAA